MADELSLRDKAGRVLSGMNAQAILDAFNATAGGLNKLSEVLQRAGVEQAAEEGEEAPPAEGEAVAEDDAPPAEEAPPEDEEAEPEEKMVMRLDQSEVNYTAATTKKGAACSNCRWFSSDLEYGIQTCQIVNGWPMPIVANGYCDRHEALTQEMFEPEAVTMERQAQREYFKVLRNLFRRSSEPDDSDFTVFKDAAGQWRWIARYTNNFQDLEGEIISEKALEQYVLRVQQGFVPLPTLRVWHIPGSDHGKAEQVFGHGSFVYAVGSFDNTPEAEHAIAEYRKSKGKTRLSQGFTHPKWAFKDGVYQVMNTFEISTLPPGAAANPFTSFEEIQTMQINAEQRQYLVKTLGEDKAASILQTAEKDTEAIKTLGVAYKDFNNQAEKPATPELTEEQIVAKMFVDTVEGQSEVLRIAQAQEAAIKALSDELAKRDAVIATLQGEIDKVKATLALAPRASESPRTALTIEEAAKVEKEIPREKDDFWGGLNIAKADNQ